MAQYRMKELKRLTYLSDPKEKSETRKSCPRSRKLPYKMKSSARVFKTLPFTRRIESFELGYEYTSPRFMITDHLLTVIDIQSFVENDESIESNRSCQNDIDRLGSSESWHILSKTNGFLNSLTDDLSSETNEANQLSVDF